MKALPAQGFAEVIGNVATVGCVLSLAIHVSTLFGSGPPVLFRFGVALLLTAFPICLVAYAAQERLLWEVPYLDRMCANNIFPWKSKLMYALIGEAPRVLQVACQALMVNALARFVIFMIQLPPGGPSALGELRLFSAYAAAFYVFAAAILISYSRRESPLSREDLL